MPEPVTLASTKKLIGTLSFCALGIAGLLCNPQRAIGQTYVPSDRVPIADGSMNTQVSTGGNSFDITGGVTRGQTLFHSFTDFSVPTNGAANFINSGNSRDIVTRVTGNTFSDINGLVNTNGANFFLINPNGVVFGSNASLNVGRIFVASTASGVDLVDGSGRAISFGVNGSGDGALLSVAPNVLFDVSRLNFGAGSGAVSNYGVLQTANFNQYIGLIGGDVTLDGGRIQVNNDRARVELGGLSAPGSIALTRDGDNLQAQFPADVARGDVSVLNSSLVSLRNGEGGDIFVTARNLEVSNASRLQVGIFNDLGGPERVAGDIKVVATGDILLADGGRISNLVGPNGVGQGGGIELEAGRNISVFGDSSIVAATLGVGSTGNIHVKAAENVFMNFSGISCVVFGGTGNCGAVKISANRNVEIDNNTAILSSVSEGVIGKGGLVEIRAGGNFVLTNQSRIRTTSLGQGDAGDINIAATGNVFLSDVEITSNMIDGVGRSGRIEVVAGQDLTAINNAFLSSYTAGQGDAGAVKITTGGNLTFDGSSVLTFVDSAAVGNGGAIELRVAKNLTLNNLASLTAYTDGQGNSGKVSIITGQDLNLDNSQIINVVSSNGVGNGSGVEINSGGNLSIINQSQVNSSSLGRGDAGSINVTASEDVVLDRSAAIRSFLNDGAIGNGGNIKVVAGSDLFVRNGSQLISSSLGQGNAGNINVAARGDVVLDGNAEIRSSLNNGAIGKGGGVEITAGQDFTVVNDALLSASTAGQGNAGNIKITVDRNITLDRGSVLSAVDNSGVGNGGNIEINAMKALAFSNSLITASTLGTGNSGNIHITAGDNLSALAQTSIANDTSGLGNAGSVNISVAGNISFKDSSGASSRVNAEAIGNGGTIDVVASNFSISNGVGLSTSSAGQGTAGNIRLTADQVSLEQGGILSNSSSFPGGNINIIAQDYLLLRNNSLITTDSFSTDTSGNGGNISARIPFLIAAPGNSDIRANAVQGNGGRIDINSQGLFGIRFRPFGSADSNDITVSSTFGQQGTATIVTPGTDPGRDSPELPSIPNDPNRQISQACDSSARINKFTVSGRGGLPPNAGDLLNSDVVWQDTRGGNNQSNIGQGQAPNHQLPRPAVAMTFDGQGRATLVAASTSERSVKLRSTCPPKTD
jgi:filamentous hemagglutinin family protein